MKKSIAVAFGILMTATIILIIIAVIPARKNVPVEPQSVGNEKIASLVIQLGDADPQKRAAAAEEIKKIGQPALPYLQRAVNSVSDNVRRELLPIIQELGGTPPVSPDEKLAALVIQLGDGDGSKRAAASDEIKKIGKPALPYLERALKAVGEDVRAQLLPIIQALGGQSPQLVQVANDLPLLPAPAEPESPPEPDLPEPKKYRLETKETLLHVPAPSSSDIEPVCSPDGKRFAYVRGQGQTLMGDGGNQSIVIDNAQTPQYIGVSRPVFSPNSKCVAYTATAGKRQFLVTDGVPGKFYEWMGEPRFSPDNKTVAFAAGADSKQFMVVGNEEGKSYKYIRSAPVFSPDGKRVAYVAKDEDKQFVVVDKRESAEFDWIDEMIFSPDSKRFAFVGVNGQRKSVVTDGEQGKEYDEIGNVVFSPDGKRMAYWAQRGKKRFLVEGGVEGKSYDKISMGSYFSPDGLHTVFAATLGAKTFIVHDGEEKEVTFSAVAKGTPLFSRDGNRVAFAAMRGDKFFVVVDGAESKPYDGIGCLPVFSPNSRHVAFLAHRDKKWLVVVNNLETPTFSGFPNGAKVVFGTSRSLHTLILQNRTDFFLLKIDLVPDDAPQK